MGLVNGAAFDVGELRHELAYVLTVGIEAPTEAITGVLEKHPDVRALFDNAWLSLFSIDDRGTISARYAGDLRWQPVLYAAGNTHGKTSSRGMPMPC